MNLPIIFDEAWKQYKYGSFPIFDDFIKKSPPKLLRLLNKMCIIVNFYQNFLKNPKSGFESLLMSKTAFFAKGLEISRIFSFQTMVFLGAM